MHGYSSKPKECNVIGDVAEFFLNPIAAIVKAAKGPKYADSKQAQDIRDAALQVQISWYEREIERIHNRFYTIPKDLPQSYLDGLSTIRPPPTTTTHPPHNPLTHWKNSYLRIKRDKFRKLYDEIKKEDNKYEDGELPDYYIHSRQKRFVLIVFTCQ